VRRVEVERDAAVTRARALHAALTPAGVTSL